MKLLKNLLWFLKGPWFLKLNVFDYLKRSSSVIKNLLWNGKIALMLKVLHESINVNKHLYVMSEGGTLASTVLFFLSPY